MAGGKREKCSGEIFVFQGNRVTWYTDFDMEWVYRVRPTANPALIDLYPAAYPKVLDYHGVYRIDGSRLYLSLVDREEARPRRFASEMGEKYVVLELHREKSPSGRIGGGSRFQDEGPP